MPKKILLAEKSDAIRSIAESILHQNGYDAISASSIEKAKELIITTQPNMVVLGADLIDSDGKYLYDSLEENPMTASLPVLLIADPSGRSLSYPDEVILPRPFDPKDFLERVRLFIGGGIEKQPLEKVETIDPFASGSIDDEFLDAALGIDNIDVEASEVMDKNFMTGKLKIPQSAEKQAGFEIHQPEDDDSAKKIENQKVESLMIREDSKSAAVKTTGHSELSSSSSQIEIAPDQYGLINPDQPHAESENRHSPHDYDWFIKEMQKEASSLIETPVKRESLNLKPNSDSIEPVGAPQLPQESERHQPEAADPVIQPGGVEQFIEEFKKEIVNITASPAETTGASKGGYNKSQSFLESEPVIDQSEIRHFSNYLAELLAERLAKEIVAKIDAEEIYRIAKDDILRLLAEKNTPPR